MSNISPRGRLTGVLADLRTTFSLANLANRANLAEPSSVTSSTLVALGLPRSSDSLVR